MFGRQIELNRKRAISLGLLRQAQICGSQAFEFGAGCLISFCFGMGEKFESFCPVIIPRGNRGPLYAMCTPPHAKREGIEFVPKLIEPVQLTEH